MVVVVMVEDDGVRNIELDCACTAGKLGECDSGDGWRMCLWGM